MTTTNGTCAECDCIHEGDWVESKLNTDVFGIVIGGSGSHLQVQLSPSLAIHAFHIETLRRMDFNDETDPGGREDLPDDDDNVIDFTKARDLRASTKTKGAA